MVDVDAVISVWEAALAAPAWDGPPVWSHGDLLAGNVLVKDGRLCGLIDFGAAGVGDPACDAMAAWTLLDSDSRDVFRETAGFDDATWARGKGWALTFISALTYYRETNPTMYAVAQGAVAAVREVAQALVGRVVRAAGRGRRDVERPDGRDGDRPGGYPPSEFHLRSFPNEGSTGSTRHGSCGVVIRRPWAAVGPRAGGGRTDRTRPAPIFPRLFPVLGRNVTVVDLAPSTSGTFGDRSGHGRRADGQCSR
ncbi:phosphotransferase [Micromonospora fulviviridis]|uniref:phosphotransferase n=1 Tax=Micromonospora fulviviridis TaxID=47860 RepID=UPI0033C708C5